MSEEASSHKKTRKAEEPMVFTLTQEGKSASGKSAVRIVEEPDFTKLPEQGLEQSNSKPQSWLGGTLFMLLSLLISLYVLDAIWRLIESLYERSPLLGQVTMVIAFIAALTLLLIVIREVFAYLRLNKVAQLRKEAVAVCAAPQPAQVDAFTRRLLAFYTSDPASAAGRTHVRTMLDDVHDPVVMLATLERSLLEDKDNAARNAIANAATRVSVITALSPRAIVDLLAVLAQSLMLISTLSTLYGGRASGLGLLRLFGRVATHLAFTGGMAMADTALSQTIGSGMAARISAKLGEGVVNGLLTARIGLATVDLCRPMPFQECDPIILSQVVKNIVFSKSVAENTAD